MDRYVVIGNPVAHSQSPFIHHAFAQQTAQDLSYERLEAPLDGFADVLEAFARAGGRGCNVTVPFKFEAFARAAVHTPRAAAAGACNALRWEGRHWLGDNTDGEGLRRDIEANAGVSLSGQRVLLLGAGGAAAGVLGPLLDAGPALLVVANRRVERAVELLDRQAQGAAVQTPHRRLPTECRAVTLSDCGQAFDVVVNATASSLAGAAVPVSSDVLRPGTLAIDLMYGGAAAGFLNWAQAHGAVGRDGLGMLVEQAAVAFEWFRGVAPRTAPVLAALRQRLDAQAV